jgi:hypothetical protein
MDRPSFSRRSTLALFWFCVGLACVGSMFAAYVFMNVPLGPDAGEPVLSSKGGIGIRNDWWQLKLAWVFSSVLIGGAAFGASVGAMIGRVRYWPVVGVFAWPLIVFAVMVFFDTYWKAGRPQKEPDGSPTIPCPSTARP